MKDINLHSQPNRSLKFLAIIDNSYEYLLETDPE